MLLYKVQQSFTLVSIITAGYHKVTCRGELTVLKNLSTMLSCTAQKSTFYALQMSLFCLDYVYINIIVCNWKYIYPKRMIAVAKVNSSLKPYMVCTKF